MPSEADSPVWGSDFLQSFFRDSRASPPLCSLAHPFKDGEEKAKHLCQPAGLATSSSDEGTGFQRQQSLRRGLGIRCLLSITADRRAGRMSTLIASWLDRGERRGGKKEACINPLFPSPRSSEVHSWPVFPHCHDLGNRRWRGISELPKDTEKLVPKGPS